MSEIDRLLQAFIRGFEQRGEADPRLYIDQLEGIERRELAALIDGYLDRAPGRRWDPDAFDSSRAAAIVDRLARTHLDPAAERVSLRELRNRAGQTRAELAARLATALGLNGGERRVEYHYHRMESGMLGAGELSERALSQLAELLATTRAQLSDALRIEADEGGQASPPLMARTHNADAELAAEPPSPQSPGTETGTPPLSDERVDEVFFDQS